MDILFYIQSFLAKEVTLQLFGNAYALGMFKFSVLLGVVTFITAIVLNASGYNSLSGSAFGFLRTVITAPVIEEVIFRLVLISVFIAVFGSPILAVLVSAVLFALGHVAYGNMRFTDTFIAGLLWGWAFVSFGLGVTIIAHMTHNFLASVIGR